MMDMDTHDSIQRVVDRNAAVVHVGVRVPPKRTLEHAIQVESRLLQAMAARKKKVRTAGGGGASAADLAESILANGVRRAAADDTPPEFPEFDLIEPPPGGPSGLDFLDDAANEQSSVEGALFETINSSTIERVEVLKQQTPAQTTIISNSAKAHIRKEQSGADRTPRNRVRLTNLLEEISGEHRK